MSGCLDVWLGMMSWGVESRIREELSGLGGIERVDV